MIKKTYTLAIGMMSGTSLDGVDACVVKIFDNLDFEIISTHSLDYPKEIETKLFEMTNNRADVKDVCFMNFALSKIYAQCAKELLQKSGIKKNEIEFISSHGQTIWHSPTPQTLGKIKTASTLQIGDISVLSDLSGITTVGDFRTKDISAGGLGAPLVPFADEIIFKRNIARAIQNIGGIGNVTVLSPNCETFAFDTGPGNMLIDYFAKKFFDIPFDKNGEIAKSGQLSEKWLEELLKEPYYSLNPPKTTGRELFNDDYAQKMLKTAPQKPEDIIATITALSAHSIFEAYQKFVIPKTSIQEIVIGGGGAYNKFLMAQLKNLFKEIPVKTHEDFGIANKFKEALAFALLGYFTIKKMPNNIPACTGAKRPVIMGKVSYQ